MFQTHHETLPWYRRSLKPNLSSDIPWSLILSRTYLETWSCSRYTLKPYLVREIHWLAPATHPVLLCSTSNPPSFTLPYPQPIQFYFALPATQPSFGLPYPQPNPVLFCSTGNPPSFFSSKNLLYPQPSPSVLCSARILTLLYFAPPATQPCCTLLYQQPNLVVLCSTSNPTLLHHSGFLNPGQVLTVNKLLTVIILHKESTAEVCKVGTNSAKFAIYYRKLIILEPGSWNLTRK